MGGMAAQIKRMAPNKTKAREATAMTLGFEMRAEAPIAPAVEPIVIPIAR